MLFRSQPPKGKKRKLSDADSDYLENTYEDQAVVALPMKHVLPIKTKNKIIPRQTLDESGSQTKTNGKLEKKRYSDVKEEEDLEETKPEEEFTFIENGIDLSQPISATQLLTTRNETLKQRKIHIGTLSAGMLENPEEKVTNLRTLLKLMDDETPEVFYTVRKLVIVSLLEIFKDVLPSYEIKPLSNNDVKLKKDTLKTQKYEENLLLYYKKYLHKLEKNIYFLAEKRGGNRRSAAVDDIKLGELSVYAMCELLVSHPYFNYAQNIAQSMIPLLNNSHKNVREIVKTSITTVFKEDKKEKITLKILRIINYYLKNHSNSFHPDMLAVLLELNIKNINVDQEKQKHIKGKKLNVSKYKLLQISKKEKKRKKKLQLLEREMLETKAVESKQTRQMNLTEITKILFGIYFRILKLSKNTKVLDTCLEGLSKYSHCINLDYYIDIVNILDKILEEGWIGYGEKLRCIQTVFVILSGQGEAVNVDPTRFYTSFYKDMLSVNAAKSNTDFSMVLRTLNEALLRRRKKNTIKRTTSFVKRLSTLSLQLLHNESLSTLGFIKLLMQLNRSLDILLDVDSSVGDGNFQPEIDDPEYSNAASTALYEIHLLHRHYHPVVCKYAKHICHGVPAQGTGNLPMDCGKYSPAQLLDDFNMSEMAFNPPVLVPQAVKVKDKEYVDQFMDRSFEDYCSNVCDI